MRIIIASIIFSLASVSFAGDTPIYPFTLGGWNFTLSSAGTPSGNQIDAILEAKHKEKNVSGEVRLDYRWYVLAHNQFEKGQKAAIPFCEALVAFSASEWSKGLNGDAVLKAMKDSPPTPDYKNSYEFLINEANPTTKPNKPEMATPRKPSD